jgi:hypothetical protein
MDNIDLVHHYHVLELFFIVYILVFSYLDIIFQVWQFNRVLVIYLNHYMHKNLQNKLNTNNEFIIFNKIEIWINFNLFDYISIYFVFVFVTNHNCLKIKNLHSYINVLFVIKVYFYYQLFFLMYFILLANFIMINNLG